VDKVFRAVQVVLPKAVHTMLRVAAVVVLVRQVLEFLVVVRCLMEAPAVLVFNGLLTLLITLAEAVVVDLVRLLVVAVAVLEAEVLAVLAVLVALPDIPEIVDKPMLVVVAVVVAPQVLDPVVLAAMVVRA
jgi:hypothetical protein